MFDNCVILIIIIAYGVHQSQEHLSSSSAVDHIPLAPGFKSRFFLLSLRRSLGPLSLLCSQKWP